MYLRCKRLAQACAMCSLNVDAYALNMIVAIASDIFLLFLCGDHHKMAHSAGHISLRKFSNFPISCIRTTNSLTVTTILGSCIRFKAILRVARLNESLILSIRFTPPPPFGCHTTVCHKIFPRRAKSEKNRTLYLECLMKIYQLLFSSNTEFPGIPIPTLLEFGYALKSPGRISKSVLCVFGLWTQL